MSILALVIVLQPKLTETPRPLPPGPSGTPVVSSNDPTKSQSIKCSQANESGYSSAVSTSSVAVSHEVTASGDRQEDTPRVGCSGNDFEIMTSG